MAEQIQYDIPVDTLSGIYKITAPGGYYYIGSTCNFKNRYYTHNGLLVRNKHQNPHLQHRYNKHPDGWSFNFVESVNNKNLLLIVEQQYLNIAKNNMLCMNISWEANKPPVNPGGNWKPSPETRALWSQQRTGRKHSKETIAKMQIQRKGKKKSAEAIKHMSEARLGKPRSQKTRLKISATLKGKPWSSARRAAQSAREV